MSSSKVILVGAIAVVFGLYTVSLYKVNGAVGNTAEVEYYLSRATYNARSGAQRMLDLWARGNDAYQPSSYSFPKTDTKDLIDANPAIDRFTDTVFVNGSYWTTFGYSDGYTYTLKIVSHGYYKSYNEPSAFFGHEVVRTVNATFYNRNWGTSGAPWYRLTVLSSYTSVNYDREKQLDSLQGYKSNIIGY